MIPVADERSPGRWFTGFDHDRFESRSAVGVIVLCRRESGEILDFGLSRRLLVELDDFLQFTTARGSREIRLNIRREGSGYLLLLNDREPLDITDRLGELGWIGAGPQALGEGAVSYGLEREEVGETYRFYARCRSGKLLPLEGEPEIGDGLYLVEARAVESVPATVSLRRIASLPTGRLPADLADGHDYYGHKGPRK